MDGRAGRSEAEIPRHGWQQQNNPKLKRNISKAPTQPEPNPESPSTRHSGTSKPGQQLHNPSRFVSNS
jgi:hypothetical protein